MEVRGRPMVTKSTLVEKPRKQRQDMLPAPQELSQGLMRSAGIGIYTAGKGKVLVMDDDGEIRDATGEMLSHIGYEVGYARDGAEAVEAYKKAIDSGESFDVVMLDLTVAGGMGGKEAMGKLKEINPAVKAIVLSGYSVHPLMADFKQWGFSEAISKPYEIAELSKVVRKVVAGVS